MSFTIDKTTYDKAKAYPVYHGYALRPYAPSSIVVHSTEGVQGQSLQSAANYLYNSADVSSDFLIGKAGEIIQFLDSRQFQAWHAGGQQSNGTWTAQPAYANPHSIGIELLHASGETWPAVQWDALAWLLGRLTHDYLIPIPSIDTHGQIAIAGPYIRKQDPTNWSHQDFIAWRDAVLAPVPPPVFVVTAGPHGAIARQDYRAQGKAAAYFLPGTAIELDDFRQNEYRHAASGIGFIAEGDLL